MMGILAAFVAALLLVAVGSCLCWLVGCALGELLFWFQGSADERNAEREERFKAQIEAQDLFFLHTTKELRTAQARARAANDLERRKDGYVRRGNRIVWQSAEALEQAKE